MSSTRFALPSENKALLPQSGFPHRVEPVLKLSVRQSRKACILTPDLHIASAADARELKGTAEAKVPELGLFQKWILPRAA